MKYFEPNKDQLDVKLTAWFIACLLLGAFIGILLMEPTEDNWYRNRRLQPSRTGRIRLRRIEEAEENTVDYER